jgi:hypothetical protein
MTEDFRIEGRFEAIVEDKWGHIKDRQIAKNTVTRGVQKYLLYQYLTANAFPAVNVANASANYSIAKSFPNSSLGIYTMKSPVVVTPESEIPPYVSKTRTLLHKDVTFFNNNGATAEDMSTMIPVPTRSGLDRAKSEWTLEYVKNTNAGIVRSIALGRNYTAYSTYDLVTATKDWEAPVTWTTAADAFHALEYTANGTIVWKRNATVANTVVGYNLLTKVYTTAVNANAYTSLQTIFGGVIVNGNAYKAILNAAPSGSSVVVKVTGYKDWYNLPAATGTNQTTLSVTFNAANGSTLVANGCQPVLVHRPGTTLIDVFCTVSTEERGAAWGYNVQRKTINVADITNLTVTSEMEDVILPYAVGQYDTGAANYEPGAFFDGKYYLPIRWTCDDITGTRTAPASDVSLAAYQEGVVLSQDLQTVINEVETRHLANMTCCWVQTGANELVKLIAANATAAFPYHTQLISAANLDAPVTKGDSDILRIIYKYRIL